MGRRLFNFDFGFQPHEIRLLLADLPSDERQRLWRDALSKTRSSGRARIGLVLSVGSMIAANLVLKRLRLGFVAELIIIVIGGCIVGMIALRIRHDELRRHIQQKLMAVGRCTSCGYDLCATPDCCPECGARKPMLEYAMPTSRQGVWWDGPMILMLLFVGCVAVVSVWSVAVLIGHIVSP